MPRKALRPFVVLMVVLAGVIAGAGTAGPAMARSLFTLDIELAPHLSLVDGKCASGCGFFVDSRNTIIKSGHAYTGGSWDMSMWAKSWRIAFDGVPTDYRIVIAQGPSDTGMEPWPVTSGKIVRADSEDQIADGQFFAGDELQVHHWSSKWRVGFNRMSEVSGSIQASAKQSNDEADSPHDGAVSVAADPHDLKSVSLTDFRYIDQNLKYQVHPASDIGPGEHGVFDSVLTPMDKPKEDRQARSEFSYAIRWGNDATPYRIKAVVANHSGRTRFNPDAHCIIADRNDQPITGDPPFTCAIANQGVVRDNPADKNNTHYGAHFVVEHK